MLSPQWEETVIRFFPGLWSGIWQLKDDNSVNDFAIQPAKGQCRYIVAALYDTLEYLHNKQSCFFQSFTGDADILVVLMAVKSYSQKN